MLFSRTRLGLSAVLARTSLTWATEMGCSGSARVFRSAFFRFETGRGL